MSFRENLKDEMEYQGITLKELSALTSVSKGSLSNYLKENCSVPAADVAVKIAKALGVSVEYLVDGSNSMESEVQSLPKDIHEIAKKMRKFSASDLETVNRIISALEEKYK